MFTIQNQAADAGSSADKSIGNLHPAHLLCLINCPAVKGWLWDPHGYRPVYSAVKVGGSYYPPCQLTVARHYLGTHELFMRFVLLRDMTGMCECVLHVHVMLVAILLMGHTLSPLTLREYIS